MDFSKRLAISFYKTIAVINEEHKIYLVQHQENKKIYIKKILDIYNPDIYESLFNNPIKGTPKIIDYLEEDNQLVIIEEYISGDSLQDKLHNSKLTQQDILKYMLDLCDIVEKLHTFTPAIIHRDIKPSNVIITNYNHAVLLDFNAAKFFSPTATEDTVLLGTQGYAAPEQYGFGTSSPQTDIYSLGILLKEMLESLSPKTDLYDSIVNKCTQMNPSERYSNINELRCEILACTKELSFSTYDAPAYVLTNNHHLKNWESSPARDKKQILPPGFRTGTPWKMLLSSVSYLIIAWLGLTLEVEDRYGAVLWFERIICLIMMLTIVASCANYLGIQRLMPLCNHRNRFVRYLGIILLAFILVSCLFCLLVIFEMSLFPTK